METITFEEVLTLVSNGAKLSELSEQLRNAWNEEVYFELDKYIDIYWYN